MLSTILHTLSLQQKTRQGGNEGRHFTMYRGLTLRNQQPLHLDENAALGILQHLDKNELQSILDNDDRMTELINDNQQIKNYKLDKESVLASNKSLADYNLSKEPRLAQGKAQLAEIYAKGIEVQKDFDKNKQKLDYVGEQQSLSTTLAVLQAAAATSEEQSEEIAEKWLDSNIEVDEFIEQFIAVRTKAHERRVKADKIAELLRNPQSQSGPTAATPYAINYGYPKY